jgi:LysM repeat protein
MKSAVKSGPIERPGHESRTFVPGFFVIALCALGIALSLHGGIVRSHTVSFSLAEDPTWPLVLLLRLALLDLSAWIGGWTIVGLLGGLVGHDRTVTVAMRVTPEFVSWTIRRSLALGMAGTLLFNNSAVASLSDPSSEPNDYVAERAYSGDVTNGQRWPAAGPNELVVQDHDVPDLRVVAGPARPSTSNPAQGPVTSGPTRGVSSVPQSTLHVTPADPRPSSTVTQARPTTTIVTDRSRTEPAVPSRPPQRYVVAAGDHFWSIAERTVLAVLPNADEQVIRDYWLKLIQRNRTLLLDPNNSDLLLVGTNLVLPEHGLDPPHGLDPTDSHVRHLIEPSDSHVRH